MKIHVFKIAVVLLIFFSITGQAQQAETLVCSGVWDNVNWSAVCSLNKAHFDIQGIENICNADSNDLYPFDERISIRIYNHFNKAYALEEFNDEKEYSEALSTYTVVNDLGDQAFALIEVKLGRLSSAIIEVVKDTHTIHFDISGNYANNSNNCFSASSVLDFARSIAEQL